MKRTLLLSFAALIILPCYSLAQYAASACGSSTCAAEFNSKPVIQSSSSNASGNCTAGKDLWVNTANLTLQACTATNTWNFISGLAPGMLIVPGYSNTSITNTANVVTVSGWYNSVAFRSGHLRLNVAVSDATHNNDAGIYTGSSGGTCTLLANIGAQTFSANAPVNLAWVQGTVTIPAGRLYFASTGDTGTTLQIAAAQQEINFVAEGTTGTTSGGALPSTFTCPSDISNNAYTTTVHGFIIY